MAKNGPGVMALLAVFTFVENTKAVFIIVMHIAMTWWSSTVTQ